ncbi:MAG: UDP-N-acetylglucosamine 1-carboxyvinyltransferase [Clostridia bacterium]|nr:UDP-N-acetylglucosamine 1-carboxyvinyltransferase [Clostridia bacterium]
MSCLIINGKKKLGGEISVHGAKNSALPILAASVAVGEECVISNCPQLSDMRATINILDGLGCFKSADCSTVTVNSRDLNTNEIPDYLMRELRSSFIFLGALVSKTGRAVLCAPGGCEIGVRPVDIHLLALRQMGAIIREDSGKIICEAPKGLHGAEINLSFPSVGATENVILAAVRAKGTTYIKNAAAEPEIKDLADFLNACGADIKGAGTSTIVINGKEKLHGAHFDVMPDRIVAVSYLAAAAVTGSRLLVKNAHAEHIGTVISTFEQSGCSFKFDNDQIYIKSPDRLNKMGTIRTMPYPGFPTDCQAIIMAMAAVARGTTIINENIFESRFRHVGELNRMGADITVTGRSAIVNGVESLYGSCVKATDLRGGMALVIAALGAEGESIIENMEFIDRGYEKTERDLSLIGADIRRE